MEEELPVLSVLPALQKSLKTSNTVILQAPPGAGKSTVLPLYLMKDPSLSGKKILMLEPRRLAAKAVAGRLSFLLNEETGNSVGYRVRFETRVSSVTRLEVLTEGILTRMLQQENALDEVGLVIFDEFHERSLQADLALVLCREIQQVLREDLKILVMSATLNADELSAALGNPSVILSEGRQYPVEKVYVPIDRNQLLHLQIFQVIRKALKENDGDILVFLPGAGEIEQMAAMVREQFHEYRVHPLYGDLPGQSQQQAILPDPSGLRKIVLATSIAETSLTIQGVKVVVDSGLARVPSFDPRTGLTKLKTVQVTKDAADQRAGRAGRTSPGICYRLWSENAHQHLVPHRQPEILDADLSHLVLELANWGIGDPYSLSWITKPPLAAVNQAKGLLRQLEALEENRITARGKEMLGLPTHPRIAHMFIVAREKGLLYLASDLAALLEEKDIFHREATASIQDRLEVLRSWRAGKKVAANFSALERADRLASQWRKILKVIPEPGYVNHDDIGILVASVYPERVAKKVGEEGIYRLANGRTAKLKENDSLLVEEWLAIAHMDAGAGQGKIFLASPLNFKAYSPELTENNVVTWDENKGILLARKERRLGELLVETAPLEKVPEDKVIQVLSGVVRKDGRKLLNWNESVSALQARILSMKKWRKDESWPDVSTDNLLSDPATWLELYLPKIRKKEDFQKLDLTNIIKGFLDWSFLNRLNELAPQEIKVPSGSSIVLDYSAEGEPPVLAVRLQEMFGLVETPAVNEGRSCVLLHLLSPGYKPVQVTQDLKSFWKNTYPEVRKQLRMRYPKHHWPEDPWTAEAVRGVKRR